MSSATKIFIILFSILACVFLFNGIPTPPYNTAGAAVDNFSGAFKDIQSRSSALTSGDVFQTASFFIFIPSSIFSALINAFIVIPGSAINQLTVNLPPTVSLLLMTPVLFIIILATIGWLFGRQQI